MMVSGSEFLNTVSKMEDDYNEKFDLLASEIMALQKRIAMAEFEIEKLKKED